MLPSPAQNDLAAFRQQLRALGESERYWRLHHLESVYRGMQYDGRPSFWDSEVPLRERAPCVVYPLARAAGRRVVSLLFGESRFPTIALDAETVDVRGATLSDEEASTLNTGIARIVKHAKLRLRMREASEAGQMCGTAVMVFSLRSGRLCVDLVPAKWCTPTFDPKDERRVMRLEIRYRYPATDESGRECHYWYRRVITDTTDVTYVPVEAHENGTEPEWTADPERTFAIEFCPVIWAKNLPEAGAVGEIDGVALFEGLEDELEAIDFALSQRHRSGLYNGEPQMLITGAKGLGGDSGRQASPGPAPGFSWLPRAFTQSGAPVEQAVKKAPGTLWVISEPGGDGKLIESTGAGSAMLSANADDLEAKVLRTAGVVMVDLASLGANASGELLKRVNEPTIALVDNLRECWGDVLTDAVWMLLRLLTTKAASESGVFLGGWQQLAQIASRFRSADGRWMMPPLSLAWGEYYEPTWLDLQAGVAAAQAANGGRPVLSHSSSVKLVAPMLGIDDVDAEVAAIEGEESAASFDVRETLGALAPKSDAPVIEKPVDAVIEGGDAEQVGMVDMPVMPGGEPAEIFGYDYDAGIVTVNEARERKGLPPIEGGTVTLTVWKAQQEAEAARILGAAGVGASKPAPFAGE